jgi:hypothetical protein
MAREIACRIHHTAYVEKRTLRVGSNLAAAFKMPGKGSEKWSER